MKIGLYFVAFFFIIGCTRQSNTTNLKVQLPSMAMSSSVSIQSSSNNWNTSLNPSTLSQFNCYAVFVGGPEPHMSKNSCTQTSTSITKFRFGPHLIFAPAGQQIILDVPSGPNRTIILAGVQAQNGACVNLNGGSPTFTDLSQPFILSVVNQNLSPGQQTVNLTRVFDANDYFDDCEINGNNQGPGGSDPINYGDGSDGNITISSPSLINVNTDTTLMGRTLSYTGRVIDINNSDGKTLTLSSAYGSDLQIGDEVMLYVSAAQDITNDNGGPDMVCDGGSKLFRATYRFGKIVSTPGANQIVLDYPITTTAINVNLLENNISPVAGNDFCKVQIVRVANFMDLTISASANTGMLTVNSYNQAAATGGILVMRVKNNLTFAATSYGFNTQGKGFGSATNSQGDSNIGIGTGGGGSNGAGGGFPGGGGANAGAGANSTGTGGWPNTFCIGSTPCIGLEKPFLGSGGAGSGTYSGGAGGGIVMVFARNIIHGGSVADFSAQANAAGGAGAGGGSGGYVTIAAENISGPPLDISASGTPGNGAGGAGGSGSIDVHVCNTPANAPNMTSAAGGAGATAVSPLYVPNDTAACGP